MSGKRERGVEVHHGWGSSAVEYSRIHQRDVSQGQARLWAGNDLSWGSGSSSRPSRQHDPAASIRYNWTVLGIAATIVLLGIVALVVKALIT